MRKITEFGKLPKLAAALVAVAVTVSGAVRAEAQTAQTVLGAAPNVEVPSAVVSGDKGAATAAGVGQPIPGQYIVTLKLGQSPRLVAALAKVTPKWIYESALIGFAAQLSDLQVAALKLLPAVAAIEQDQAIVTQAYYTQTMDSTSQPWGLDRIDQRSGRNNTYTYWSNAGRGVNAYIIDSGIATANPDFGGRARMVYDAFNGNGQDCMGHGTHVAGTVGGARYGVAKAVTLLGVRVIGCNDNFAGGSSASAIAGVDWVKRNAVKPAVANISWHVGVRSAALNTATSNLVNSGVFVSVAAGNDKLDACNDSPSSAAGTLTVAASDFNDTRATFSNWGACVDLYAPGVAIKSAHLNGGTAILEGTSMAAPHVAGVAALLKADYGDRPSTTINAWILNATTTNVIKSNVSGTPNRLLFMNGW